MKLHPCSTDTAVQSVGRAYTCIDLCIGLGVNSYVQYAAACDRCDANLSSTAAAAAAAAVHLSSSQLRQSSPAVCHPIASSSKSYVWKLNESRCHAATQPVIYSQLYENLAITLCASEISCLVTLYTLLNTVEHGTRFFFFLWRTLPERSRVHDVAPVRPPRSFSPRRRKTNVQRSQVCLHRT